MSDTDVTMINAEESDSTPSQELSPEDKLVNSLMEPKAPSEDKPKKPKAKKPESNVVTTETAATLSDDTDSSELEDALPEDGEEQDDPEEETEEQEEEPDTEEDKDPEDPEEDDEGANVVYTTPDGDEVTLDELKRGYLRQSDYTKKTQSLSEEKQNLQQGFQALEQHNETIAEHLSLALNVVEPQLAQLAATDWDQLATDDPYEYAEKRALYDQASVRYQKIQQAAQQTLQQAQQQQAHAQAQRTQQEQQKLQMALPDLADPKVGPKLARNIKEYALSMGLSEKEASGIVDHRIVVMLNKARLYDEMSHAQQTVVKKKLNKSPTNVARAGQPSSKAEQANTKIADLRNRVKRSGSVDDLVELLLSN